MEQDRDVVKAMEWLSRMISFRPTPHLKAFWECMQGLLNHLRDIISSHDYARAERALHAIAPYGQMINKYREIGVPSTMWNAFEAALLDLQAIVERSPEGKGKVLPSLSLSHSCWSLEVAVSGKLRFLPRLFEMQEGWKSVRGVECGTIIYVMQERVTVVELCHWPDSNSHLVSECGGRTSEEQNWAKEVWTPEGRVLVCTGRKETDYLKTYRDQSVMLVPYQRIDKVLVSQANDLAANPRSVPQALVDLVLDGWSGSLPQQLVSWVCESEPTNEIANAVLPLLGRESFSDVSGVCEHLCDQYQWPVGQQEARRVLPQLAYYNRDGIFRLMDRWMNSDKLYRVKSAAMMLGNLALMDWPHTSELVEIVLDHSEETVRKEAARALPNIIDLSLDLADLICERAKCFQSVNGMTSYARIVNSYREEFAGIGLSGIPGYLSRSPDLAFEKVESAVHILRKYNLLDDNLNSARNYIFANVLPLAEANPMRLTNVLENLEPFVGDTHIQVDLLVASARLASHDMATALFIFQLAESHLDQRLSPLFDSIRGRLII